MHRKIVLGLKTSIVRKERSRQETVGIITYKGQPRKEFTSHQCHWLRLSKINREMARTILLFKAQRSSEVLMKIDKSITRVYCNKTGACHQPPSIKMEANSSNQISKGVQTVEIIHSKWVASQLVQAGLQTRLIKSTVWASTWVPMTKIIRRWKFWKNNKLTPTEQQAKPLGSSVELFIEAQVINPITTRSSRKEPQKGEATSHLEDN